MPKDQKILVVNLAGMGDIVLSSSSMKALREANPHSEMCLLTWRKHLELIEACPYFSRVFTFRKLFDIRNLLEIGTMRRCRFDAAVNLYNIHSWAGALKMFLLFGAIRAQESFGRDTDGKGFFCAHKLKEVAPLKKHDVDTMRDVVAMLGARKKEKNELELWVRERSERTEEFFKQNNISGNDCVVSIHPGAGRRTHRWRAEYFARVADALYERYGAKIIITGSAQEKNLVLRVARKMTAPAACAAGAFSISDLASCLKRAQLFITNDTGPMHMANVLGIPMIVISGNSPEAFLPYKKEKTAILRKASLNAVTPQDVIETAQQFLGPQKPSVPFSAPVKVLHVHTRAIIGGSSANTLFTLQGLPKNKYTGHLACGFKNAQESFLQEVAAKNIPFYNIPHMFNRMNIVNDGWALFELFRLIKKEKYTIVHTHNSKAGVLGRLAAKAAGVPVVIHTVHSCVFHYYDYNWFWRRIFLWIEKATAPLADDFIAISDHIREEYVKYTIVPPKKIRVIYSGIEIEKYKAPVTPADGAKKREELGLKSNGLAVGVVARMERGKGYEYLMEAIPEVIKRRADVSFLLVGEGPLRNQLEEKVRHDNMHDRVIFAGLRRDVDEILRAVDIFCLPSLYEGMGRVLLEAQASGRPVVAAKSGGIPNVVCENKTALLVNPKETGSISTAILQLAGDAALRKEMGRAGEAFVDERFSARKMVENIVGLYGEMLIKSATLVYSKKNGYRA